MNNNFVKKIGILLLILLVTFGTRQYLAKKQETMKVQESIGRRERIFAPKVPDNNRILQYFKENFPQKSVILACEEDITDDQLKDLLVIYEEGNEIRVIAVCDNGDDSYYISPEIPAPVENQTIQFMNIDNEGEIEFVISGEKQGAVGYAIYRMIEGEIKDLFGEGMDDCC